MRIVPPDQPKNSVRQLANDDSSAVAASRGSSDGLGDGPSNVPSRGSCVSASPTLGSASASSSAENSSCTPSPSPIPEPAARSTARHARHMRIEWADVARAVAFFAIVALVIARLFAPAAPDHVPPTLDASVVTSALLDVEDPIANVSSLLGSFALPLLFLSIGYTMRRQRLTLSYVEDLIGKYLIPYVVFGFVAAVIYGVFSSSHDMFAYLAALIYGNGGLRGEFLLGYPFAQATLPVLWVLPAIAVGQLVTFALSKLPLISRIVAAGIVFLVGTASAGHVFLPFGIQPGMCAAWFMTCGGVLREQHAFSSWGWEKVMLAFVLTLGVVYIALVSLGFMTVPDYSVANYHYSILDMLGGVCAAGCFMAIAQTVALSDSVAERFLCWVGKNFLACLSCFAVVFACLFCASSALSAASDAIGYVPAFAIFAVLSAVLSCTGAWCVSKTPYLRAIFSHFGVPLDSK